MDLLARELWRANELVSVEPRAFDILVYLIRNRDRAVEKNELQDEVWPGVVVGEAALTRCIMKARRAIGDDPELQAAIKTVRGHGYRFVHDLDVSRGPPMRSTPLALPDKPSLAVLPFVNLSNDPDQEYFSDGITEDIITELSRFRSLFVVASHSSFKYKRQAGKTQEIASDLGVAYVVDGSIQRAGGRIRVNVRLADAQSGTQLWSERYDRELEDILRLQEEVAATVAATVGGRVDATRGRQRFNASSLASYDYVLRAQALYYQVDKTSNEEARELLEMAIGEDSQNARALILLAAVHSMSSWSFWAEDNEEAQRLSLELGQQSIDLDDTDSLAHALFGEILFDCGSNELAEFHFLRAISLNPNDIAARALYGSKLSAMGRRDEAADQLAIAERLDPFGLHWIPWVKGNVLFAAGRYEEAVAALQTMSRPPNEARYMLAAALAMLGRNAQASVCLAEYMERASRDMPHYPGENLDNWRPFFRRMLDYRDEDDLDRVMDALNKAQSGG